MPTVSSILSANNVYEPATVEGLRQSLHDLIRTVEGRKQTSEAVAGPRTGTAVNDTRPVIYWIAFR